MLDSINESVVRDKIEEILSSGEFAAGGNDSSLTDYLAGWIKGIVEWIKDRLESIKLPDMKLNMLPETRFSYEAAVGFKIAAVVIISGLIFFILFFILRRLRSSKKVKLEEDILLINTLKDPDRVLDAALAFSKKGDFRQGLRYLYISAILKFNEQSIIHIDKSKTNREYLNEIRNSGFSRYNDMACFTRAFNDYWYGSKHITSEIFGFWFAKYSELLKEVAI